MNNENTPSEVKPVVWRRPRKIGIFNRAAQLIMATAVWWQNVPKASILKQPGNAYQPAPLPAEGPKAFAKGPLSSAKVVQKFKDLRSVPYVRLNRGTIIRAEAKVESKTRRHRNEVANRPGSLKKVRHTLDPNMLEAAI